jgi:hypothetical protein
MNYDFKANWESKIMPLLNIDDDLQKAIKKGIQSYLRNERARCNLDGIDKNLVMRYNKNIPPCKYGKYDDTEEMEYIKQLKNSLVLPSHHKAYLNDWRSRNYKTYCLYGSCFWWNKTFGLTLAQLVMPNENWIIIENDLHLTIANENRTCIFDILLYDEDDKLSFGGKKALDFATFKGSKKDWYMRTNNWNEKQYNEFVNHCKENDDKKLFT